MPGLEIDDADEDQMTAALRESDEYEAYRDLVEQVSPYLGTDATQDLKVEDDDEAPLLQLARLRAYIVATVARIGQGLPEMERDELQMFDGQADEVRDVQNDSFVASDGMVYDLTGERDPGRIPCHGVFYMREISRNPELTTPGMCYSGYAVRLGQPQLPKVRAVPWGHRDGSRAHVVSGQPLPGSDLRRPGQEETAGRWRGPRREVGSEETGAS